MTVFSHVSRVRVVRMQCSRRTSPESPFSHRCRMLRWSNGGIVLERCQRSRAYVH